MIALKARNHINGVAATLKNFLKPHLLPLFLFSEEKKDHRIKFLDGMRGIAILLVIFFHYFARWIPPKSENLYPYKDIWARFPLFRQGYLGVYLFFMISGFVIYMTLEKSNTIKEFFIRRWSRLFPAMLVCSLITFTFALIIPEYPFNKNLTDLLPGFAFIRPEWLSYLTNHAFQSMDGAYWTLYVEVEFYIVISFLYFYVSKNNVLYYLTIYYLSVAVFTYVGSRLFYHFHIPGNIIIWSLRDILILRYMPWFCIGIAIYKLYNRHDLQSTLKMLAMACVAVIFFSAHDRIAVIITMIVFYLPFRFETVRKLFSNTSLVLIGVVSYPLYLVHQNLGVALIKISDRIVSNDFLLVVPFVMAGCMLVVGIIIHQKIELPAQRFIRKLSL